MLSVRAISSICNLAIGDGARIIPRLSRVHLQLKCLLWTLNPSEEDPPTFPSSHLVSQMVDLISTPMRFGIRKEHATVCLCLYLVPVLCQQYHIKSVPIISLLPRSRGFISSPFFPPWIYKHRSAGGKKKKNTTKGGMNDTMLLNGQQGSF